MLNTQNKKNKVILADYPFKRDIANRLFLASLSPSEIDILRELLCHGTKLPLQDLAESTDVVSEALIPILTKFSSSGLLLVQNETVFVDKEMRKYFEFQIRTFDPAFEPNLDYFQGLLAKVPISVLPSWYSIPKTSDNIFTSIVEKYLCTPKVYEKYVNELVFEDPLCQKILQEVLSAPSFELSSDILQKRLKLSKEKLQECMLLLEYHFVLASRFAGKCEIISPFQEWKDYLIFEHRGKNIPKCNEKRIVKRQSKVFDFSEQDQAFYNFRKSLNALQDEYGDIFGSVEKGYRELEKALRDNLFEGWILVDDFIRHSAFVLGHQEPVTLRRTGKKWHYALPSYNKEERAFITRLLTDLLFEMGVTAYGEYEGKLCFSITSSGRVTLA